MFSFYFVILCRENLLWSYASSVCSQIHPLREGELCSGFSGNLSQMFWHQNFDWRVGCHQGSVTLEHYWAARLFLMSKLWTLTSGIQPWICYHFLWISSNTWHPYSASCRQQPAQLIPDISVLSPGSVTSLGLGLFPVVVMTLKLSLREVPAVA